MKTNLQLLSTLININSILNDILSIDNSDINELSFEIIYSVLADNDIYNDFLNQLNSNDKQIFINGTIKEKLDIYKKTKDKLNADLRYDLLNYNIEQELEQLQKYNPFAYQKLQEIILLSINTVLKYNEYQENNVVPFPIEKTIDVVSAFFKEIDKSNNLYNLFKQKLIDGSILLWDSNDKNIELKMIKKHKELVLDTKGWKVFNEDNNLYLNAPYDNTILDIYKLVHEFIHLYIYSNKKDILEVTSTEIFFEEFPPIYYETILKDYLIKIGFPESIAQIAIKERENAYISDVNSLITLSNLIKIKQQRLITKDDLETMYNINALKAKTKNLNKSEREQYYQEMRKCGINLDSEEETAKNICDNLNSNIISFEYTEHKRINYIIAKLLTEHINKKTNNNNTLKSKILYITKVLGTTEQEPNEVLEFLECDDLFKNIKLPPSQQEENSTKTYKYQ